MDADIVVTMIQYETFRHDYESAYMEMNKGEDH